MIKSTLIAVLLFSSIGYGQEHLFDKSISPIANRIWTPFKNKIELLSSNYKNKSQLNGHNIFEILYHATGPIDRCNTEGENITVFLIQYKNILDTDKKQEESIQYLGCNKLSLFELKLTRLGTSLKPLNPLSIQKGELEFIPKGNTTEIRIDFLDYKADSLFNWTASSNKKRKQLELYVLNQKLIAANYEESTHEFYINSATTFNYIYQFYGASFNRSSAAPEEPNGLSIIAPMSNILSSTYIVNQNQITSQSDYNKIFNDDILLKVDENLTNVINIILTNFTPITQTPVVTSAETSEYIQKLNVLLTQGRTNTINTVLLDEVLIQLLQDIESGKIEINSD